MDPKSRNLTYHHGAVSRTDRERLLNQRGAVLWFTGLSGSGKSTVSHAVEHELYKAGHLVQVLDGDNVRHGLCKDLGFSDDDRTENIRRIAEVAKLSVDAGLLVLTAFISPFRADRDAAREVVGTDRFLEVFLDVPIEECERRDPKGLYKKVRAGEIAEFTGVSSPYEPPASPEISLPTAELTIGESAARVVAHLRDQGFLSPPPNDTSPNDASPN